MTAKTKPSTSVEKFQELIRKWHEKLKKDGTSLTFNFRGCPPVTIGKKLEVELNPVKTKEL